MLLPPGAQRVAGKARGRARRQLATSIRDGLVGAVALLLAWELLAGAVFPGRHLVPPPSAVVSTMVSDGFYWAGLKTTLWEAARGFAIGNCAAFALAIVCLAVPALSRFFHQVGAVTYCVPTVAVGPLLLVFLSADTTKVVMSALSVFFVSLVAWTTGLATVDPVHLEVVHAFGGNRWDELFRARLRGALTSAGGGLALSAPAAVLGAVIGEYLGGNSGLGVDMVSAEQQLQVARTWAIGTETTMVCGACYLIVLALARLGGGTPAPGMGAALATRPTSRGYWVLGRPVLASLASLAAIVGGWALLKPALGLSSYFAKSPLAVWQYLVSGPGAAANLAQVTAALATTLRDAAAGWLLGTAAALVTAALMMQLPRVRSVVYPVVMVLRSVPLIAMVPLITLVLGQGDEGVASIAAIVSFVPTLVLVVSGLETVPPQALELARAYHATRRATLLVVCARYATPNLFAAAKVAMPGSVLGAVLAEWLITGSGVGHLMAADLIGSNFSSLWAVVVIVSGVSLVLYEVVGTLEAVLRRQLTA